MDNKIKFSDYLFVCLPVALAVWFGTEAINYHSRSGFISGAMFMYFCVLCVVEFWQFGSALQSLHRHAATMGEIAGRSEGWSEGRKLGQSEGRREAQREAWAERDRQWEAQQLARREADQKWQQTYKDILERRGLALPSAETSSSDTVAASDKAATSHD